jgi:hypothetical protein
VRPSPSGHESGNAASRHFKEVGDLLLGKASRCPQRADSANVFISQLCLHMLFAPVVAAEPAVGFAAHRGLRLGVPSIAMPDRPASDLVHVRRVVLVRSQGKMGRFDTAAIGEVAGGIVFVTKVLHLQPGRDGSVMIRPPLPQLAGRAVPMAS